MLHQKQNKRDKQHIVLGTWLAALHTVIMALLLTYFCSTSSRKKDGLVPLVLDAARMSGA